MISFKFDHDSLELPHVHKRVLTLNAVCFLHLIMIMATLVLGVSPYCDFLFVFSNSSEIWYFKNLEQPPNQILTPPNL